MARYYATDGTLARLIADPDIPISDVVREAERLCRREAYASEYYRKHPELLFPNHPWMAFVRSGGAGYLGWSA